MSRHLSRLLVVLTLAVTGLCDAHELLTAALRMDEGADGGVTATLNTPLGRDGQPITVVPAFDPRCPVAGEPRVERDGDRIIREWRLQCAGGLDGTRLRFDGLDPRTPEALITVHFASGAIQTLAVDRHDPSVALHASAAQRNAVAVSAYLPLGIEHILLGPDHLLFVFGLMLIVATVGGGLRLLVASLTAFTLAHSLTLGLAMFGIWGLPPKPVEILIALSIVLLAVELAGHTQRRARGLPPTLTLRKPWLVAFVFGLLHGFGFAGALSEVGLPDAARGWALLLFNLGVEIGQLIFVASVLLIAALGRRRWPHLRLQTAGLTLALGAVAVYWTLDRTAIWLAASSATPHFGA
ncbi:MAG: HupE/UreJ family protein [Nevskiaceae bacterium]|nr:MAG: HupE/UreJ family protein [Nevskiaceae bacterium]